jgi:hypothetical protein
MEQALLDLRQRLVVFDDKLVVLQQLVSAVSNGF